MKYLKKFYISESIDFNKDGFIQITPDIDSISDDDLENFMDTHQLVFLDNSNNPIYKSHDVSTKIKTYLSDLFNSIGAKNLEVLLNRAGHRTIVKSTIIYIENAINFIFELKQIDNSWGGVYKRYNNNQYDINIVTLKDEYYLFEICLNRNGRTYTDAFIYIVDGTDNIKSSMRIILNEIA